MSNVHALPDTMHRQWRVYEKNIRSLMAERGLGVQAIDKACETLRPIFLGAAVPTKFEGESVDAALMSLSAWIEQQISRLLAEIALREVELIEAGLR